MQSLQYKFIKLNKYYYNGIILIYDRLYELIKFQNKDVDIPLQYYNKNINKNDIENNILKKVEISILCKINTDIKYKNISLDGKEINWLYITNKTDDYGFSDIYIDMILYKLDKLNIHYETRISIDRKILLFNDKSTLFDMNPLIVLSSYNIKD